MRVMVLALGIGGLIFAGLAAPDFLAQSSRLDPTWNWAIAASFVLSVAALAALARVAPMAALRSMCGAVAGIYLVALATVIPALRGSELPEGDRPWIIGLATIAVSAAAVALRSRFAWGYLAVVVGLVAVVLWFESSPPDVAFVVQETTFDLFFGAVFVGLALASGRAGRSLDEVAADAMRESARLAAASARDRQRARINALVHDSVLVALLASTRSDGRGDAVRHQAQHALRQLDEFEAQVLEGAASTGRDLAWQLQAITTELAPDADFDYELSGTLEVPPSVVLAVSEASAEAIRNSVIHAGIASRAVHLAVDDRGVRVDVIDDGIGFDPDAVPSARLGIIVSITGRMNNVPGGRAVVVSRLGTGTRVSIRWSAAETRS